MTASARRNIILRDPSVAQVRGTLCLVLLLFSLSTALTTRQGTAQEPIDWERELDMLRSVPYIAFSEAVIDEKEAGVVLYDREKAYEGYNFFCTRASCEAFLLDMAGRAIHRWTWAHLPGKSNLSDYAVMLENGDLLAIRKHLDLLRLTWNSKLMWKRDLAVHHDVTPAPDGTLYAVAQEVKEHRGLRVRFAVLVHLTADGEEIDRWSSYERLGELKSILDTRSFLDAVLDSAFNDRRKFPRGRSELDYFHMNTVGVLPATGLAERDARFQRGHLLVCFRNVNQIAILEKETYRVLWAWGEGELEWPHHPTMLDNGHILIFDNGVRRHYSRVVELDPVAETIVWEYIAEPPEGFYSYQKGSAQRLPNGNTLICEGDRGRVFEVTREGEVVWVWLNPTTRGRHRETVYRMIRLPSAQVELMTQSWWRWWWR